MAIRTPYRDSVKFGQPFRDHFHVLLWRDGLQIGVHNPASLMKKVAQMEKDVDLQRGDLRHHLGGMEEFFFSYFSGSRAVGGV